MKKFIGILSLVVMVALISLFASCKKSDPVPAIDPFSNGTDARSMIVVLSDMHLGADLTYAECNTNRGPLEKLLRQIRVAPNVKELVIAGDLLDEWFVPATTDTYEGKDQSDFVKRLALTNKGIFDVLKQIINDGIVKVTYVPGNHDLGITAANVELILPGINQARDDEQGLGTYTPADFNILAIEHGHRYNFFCAPDPISNIGIAPGSIQPCGYFFTRVAALHVTQNCKTPLQTLPAVTQDPLGDASQTAAFYYWKVWDNLMTLFPINNMLDDKVIVTNVDGYTQNYSIKDFMPYQLIPGGIIDMDLYKGVQDNWDTREDLNHVAVKFPAAQAIADANDNNKTDDQAKTQYFLNPQSNVRIVVFGHTHQPEIIASENLTHDKTIYANSGTWIDNNQGLTTTNFVVITPQTASASSYTTVKLYNFENEIVTPMALDSLRYQL